ncbi:magnesium/cobalt transporter CorA [Vitiosangium sp. GDMCC 1.1324]|uniref:magnesium/cobalt transporter CorA n=1 Tax=Vitiosangium sp. (strain GDMCC 1.1324) TaxID=2138576 RepID=UPI000D37E4D5|nr:magnesium/cobalt transporter CorA [Vitiosangium sp. GDMCC 1.1324]PTL77312.1 magnesium and cobalt transport protein CorA [Vitiosangium sp. GDMCC 1.1324]
MLQVLLLNEGKTLTGGEELLDRPGPKWIDVLHPTEELMQRLGERYGLHKLAIEDCLHLDQRPKLEEYPNHQFIVLQGFTSQAGNVCDLTLHEHHFFLGQDWLISVHELPYEGLEAVRKRVQDEPQATIGRGLDFVLYLLADALVDRNFPILDRFNEELEDLESDVFENTRSEQLQRIFELKRALVTLRRVLSPQRDVLGILSKRGTPNVQERTALYFRDIYDHLVRLYEQIDAGRDLLGNVMDGYLSMVANRTNDITKQLTIFATIFLPLSFITGFFGQNFDVLTRQEFFWVMMVSVVGLPVALMFWFKRKQWI